jgi:hypothetical protein
MIFVYDKSGQQKNYGKGGSIPYDSENLANSPRPLSTSSASLSDFGDISFWVDEIALETEGLDSPKGINNQMNMSAFPLSDVWITVGKYVVHEQTICFVSIEGMIDEGAPAVRCIYKCLAVRRELLLAG